MTESQASITAWADDTFGPVSSNARLATRANEEMAELLRCLAADPKSAKAPEECADVAIVLCRLASRQGVELSFAPDETVAGAAGPQGWSPLRLAANANRDLSALLLVLARDDGAPVGASVQWAVRLLSALAQVLGTDLPREIDSKMARNRQRTWNLDGTGHGYHVRSKEDSCHNN